MRKSSEKESLKFESCIHLSRISSDNWEVKCATGYSFLTPNELVSWMVLILGMPLRQRMRWLDGIIDSMDMSLSKSGSWWWTGKPGVLQSIGLQRVGHGWANELNLPELTVLFFFFFLKIILTLEVKNLSPKSDRHWLESITSNLWQGQSIHTLTTSVSLKLPHMYPLY